MDGAQLLVLILLSLAVFTCTREGRNKGRGRKLSLFQDVLPPNLVRPSGLEYLEGQDEAGGSDLGVRWSLE